MRLNKDDTIVTAFAYAPGWSSLLIVIVRDKNRMLREERIQREEFSPELQQLFSISLATQVTMLRALKSEPSNKRR